MSRFNCDGCDKPLFQADEEGDRICADCARDAEDAAARILARLKEPNGRPVPSNRSIGG